MPCLDEACCLPCSGMQDGAASLARHDQLWPDQKSGQEPMPVLSGASSEGGSGRGGRDRSGPPFAQAPRPHVASEPFSVMQTRLADRTGFVAIFIKPEFTSDVGEARGIHRAPVLGLLHT